MCLFKKGDEICEMAFKGRRDLVLFTNKRILFVDKKGWSGNKMAFTSFPYTSVKVFQVTTAGKEHRNQYWHLKINSLWSDKILDSFILIKQKLEFLCRINPIYQLLMLWNALHSYLVLIRFHYLNVNSGTKLHSLDWISWSIPFFLITKKDL